MCFVRVRFRVKMSNTLLQETEGLPLGTRIGEKEVNRWGRSSFHLICVEKIELWKHFKTHHSGAGEKGKSWSSLGHQHTGGTWILGYGWEWAGRLLEQRRRNLGLRLQYLLFRYKYLYYSWHPCPWSLYLISCQVPSILPFIVFWTVISCLLPANFRYLLLHV